MEMVRLTWWSQEHRECSTSKGVFVCLLHHFAGQVPVIKTHPNASALVVQRVMTAAFVVISMSASRVCAGHALVLATCQASQVLAIAEARNTTLCIQRQIRALGREA